MRACGKSASEMKELYLDNSATTPLLPEAAEAIRLAFETYANPSSLHSAGIAASKLLAESRRTVADGSCLGASYTPVFCGSGSEANNLAIRGFCGLGKHFDSKRIIISDSEHPSVAASAESLSALGFETVMIPTKGGELDLGALESELRRGAALVSVMSVNNETGALYDIPAALSLCRQLCPGAIFHTDAVQGFMRIPLTRCADMISVSAHKIGGPKGCGALFVRGDLIRRRALSPVVYGGGQESGLRSGTENTAYAAGFAAAVRVWSERGREFAAEMRETSLAFIDVITASGCRVNRPPRTADYIISATLPGIKSQVMLSFLSSKGIYVSSGSACSSKDRKISSSLKAFGLSDRDADCTIRISLSPAVSKKDAEILGDALREGIDKLVKIK